MIRSVITGADGMLGSALRPLLDRSGYQVYATDISSAGNGLDYLDVQDATAVRGYIFKVKPDIVFHLAAETDVDKCELKPDHAYLTNAQGTRNLALLCKELDIPLIYISTGAVFDGKKKEGYTEDDQPHPISVYGKSKLKGEEEIKSLLEKYYIVRAGWMIGGHDKDKKFVWKIVQLMKNKPEIPVVTDKQGSPTFTGDFARGIMNIVETKEYGIYHCVNKGICTRFDIAEKIREYLGKKDVLLKPVTSAAFPLPAPRGDSEALINQKLSKMGINNMRHWTDCLKDYLEESKALL